MTRRSKLQSYDNADCGVTRMSRLEYCDSNLQWSAMAPLMGAQMHGSGYTVTCVAGAVK